MFFSNIIQSDSFLYYAVFFPPIFRTEAKNKPNYFWCDHFNFKNHQLSSSSILITKKLSTFCIENWHPFLSNLSTHYKQWKIKKMKKNPRTSVLLSDFFTKFREIFYSGIICIEIIWIFLEEKKSHRIKHDGLHFFLDTTRNQMKVKFDV